MNEGHPDVLSTPTQAQRQVGHGLSLALMSPTGSSEVQVFGGVSTASLASAGLDLTTAYAHAYRNLSQALSNGQISLELFENGPAGGPMAVASGHWLAATTLVAPGLRDRMIRLLGDDIVAAVPHRDLLFLFSGTASAAMRAAVEEEFQSAAKPLTMGLFALGNDGPSPIQ